MLTTPSTGPDSNDKPFMCKSTWVDSALFWMSVPSHSKTQTTLAISTGKIWSLRIIITLVITNQVRNHIDQVFVYDLSYTELICWVWFIISMILSQSLCQNSPRSLSLPSVILSLLDWGLAAPASLVVLVSTIAANSHGANLEAGLWYLQFAHWVVTSLLKSFSGICPNDQIPNLNFF